NLTFEEAALGCTKEISVVRDDPCDVCKGSGAKAGTSPATCPTCKGSGQVRVTQNTFMGTVQMVQTCNQCGGSGKVVKDPCTKCNGRGKLRGTKKISFKVPAGIDHGQVITMRGQGEQGDRGAPAGDLLIQVSVRPHKFFKRKNYDLYCDVPVSFAHAALGGDIEVPTLGQPIKYTVPEGTQSGTTFRVRGAGIQQLQGSGKGDLFIKINVEVPKKLNDEQKSLLLKFEGSMTGREYGDRRSFFERMKDAFN
ncbi:MAG: molecular chaperone DnaJ, partial [Clostridiales bacterium]|nr:molecular chaperone DnaJ [Clostridiales bacterium]